MQEIAGIPKIANRNSDFLALQKSEFQKKNPTGILRIVNRIRIPPSMGVPEIRTENCNSQPRSPPQMSMDAPASTADPPPPLPWAASVQREPTHQGTNPNASQAKQAPLPPPCHPGPRACSASRCVSSPTPAQAERSKRHSPPPAAAAAAAATAAAAANVHGCAAANALTLPSTPPCRRLPNNSAALHCHFLCGNGAGGANYLGKQGVYFFLKMELIQLYIHRVNRFPIIHFL